MTANCERDSNASTVWYVCSCVAGYCLCHRVIGFAARSVLCVVVRFSFHSWKALLTTTSHDLIDGHHFVRAVLELSLKFKCLVGGLYLHDRETDRQEYKVTTLAIKQPSSISFRISSASEIRNHLQSPSEFVSLSLSLSRESWAWSLLGEKLNLCTLWYVNENGVEWDALHLARSDH